MKTFFNIMSTAIDAGAVIVYTGMGELMLERTGVMNLGLEGMIAIGAATAVIAAQWASTPFIAAGVAVLVGAVMGLAFAIAVVVVRANQVLVGLAMFLIGTGLAAHLGGSVAGNPPPISFNPVAIPWLSDIPQVGDALFNHDPLVYFGYLALPIIVWFVLNRTRHGINLNAVGEDPAAADASGVSVMGIRMFYAILGGAFAGLGGATLSLAFTRVGRRASSPGADGSHLLSSSSRCGSPAGWCLAPSFSERSSRCRSSLRTRDGTYPDRCSTCSLTSSPLPSSSLRCYELEARGPRSRRQL